MTSFCQSYQNMFNVNVHFLLIMAFLNIGARNDIFSDVAGPFFKSKIKWAHDILKSNWICLLLTI